MRREPLAPPSQSAGQLAAELGVRTATLLGQEFALAKAELRATARTAGTGATLLGAAAGLGVSAWLVLLAAGVAGLAVVLPVWAAAMIVFGILALPAALLAAMAARWLARARPLLPLTTESLREDLQVTREWARR
jgi:cation transporter-like permease